MADVAQRSQTETRIDYHLDYLLREWWSLPAIAAEWDTWEDLDQLVFVLEWPIREDRLHQLQEWVRVGLLTPTQQSRYRELLNLMSKYRPMLDRLLSD
jgi:predicted NUDIX family NTP pyrophosphohydrolase